jgi:hypothetical protein
MTMTAELLKIMKLLEENGIPALSIKGPVLSQMIHGDVTQRQYADIDILLERSDMYRAVKILTDVGCTTEHPIEFLNNETLLDVAKDYSVFSATHNIHVEFHWQLFLNRQVKKSKINLFRDSNPICVINQYGIKTLEPDANMIYLLLHGSKHMWERLEWIVDIDRLIRLRGDEIDWDRLCQLAREMEIEVMFYLGLAVVHDLFQTPLKDEIIEKIASMEKVTQAKEFIVKRILENTIHEQATKSVPFVNLFKMRLNKDSRLGVIRHYFATLFSLKDFDVYMVNIPNKLSFLYHFVRLYRMFRFYVLQMPHR